MTIKDDLLRAAAYLAATNDSPDEEASMPGSEGDRIAGVLRDLAGTAGTDERVQIPPGDGPHEPALLTTDAAMLAQARELREWLIERAVAESDDSAAHTAYCYRLRAAVQYLVQGLEAEGEVDRAQHVLLEQTQQEVKRLQAELEETMRPLDAQMQRLNERVVEANAEIDRLYEMLAKHTGSGDVGVRNGKNRTTGGTIGQP
jgi:hypothetical protein